MMDLLGPDNKPLSIEVKKASSTRAPTFISATTDGHNQVGGAVPHPRRYDWRTYYDMFERHPTVYAAINKIVKVATNTGFEFIPRSVQDEIENSETKDARAFFESLPDFKEQLRVVYQHLMIFGDAYMYVVPNRRRKPARLKTLPPWTVNIKAKKNGDVEYYFQIDPDDPRGGGIRFKPHEILHFKMPNPKDSLYGLSPLEPLKGVVLTDILAENFNRTFFKNGASTGTVFIFNGATNDQLERMRKWINEKYVGTENAHLPFVIDGDVKIERSVASHQDMGFLEGRAAIEAQILAVLDVPPAKLGKMETANRSNAKEQDKSFRTEAIMPLQFIVESALSDQLLRDTLGITQTLFKHVESDVRDRQEQAELWTRYVQNGIMNINEIRGLMGLAAIKGGDINYVMAPTGAVPVVDLELYFKIPQTNTDKIPAHLHDSTHPNAHPGSGNPRDGGGGYVGPEPEPRDTREVLEVPSAKSVKDSSAYSAVMSLIHKAHSDEAVLRHCWAYCVDAKEETQDVRMEPIVTTLRKAMRTNDEELRTVYVERAQGWLGVLGGGAS